MFFKTPTDIQKIIFSHMELNSLIKASQVSKQWHRLANNTLQYQKRVLGYRFLQIKNNPKLAEKFSLKEAVYGYISAQNNSLIDAINASSAYCQHMKDKLNKQEIEESFRWALSDESSLTEKQNFLNLIRNNPEWLRILSVKDAAEICIKAGNQRLGAVKHWYKKETGNDIDQYMKEHIPNANQQIVQILVKEALSTHKPYYEISILGEIISKPELIQYLSVKDAAEICIKAGNRQLGALKYQYKKETGNDIDQYMREHIPNANQQIAQILVKEALSTH
ncbi:TPA: F-box protein, partial [Legionella pneumophila]|nr:F-box protein [Legionella pneumophila]HBI2948091.1 F-box protein [Legionella pneumophila]